MIAAFLAGAGCVHVCGGGEPHKVTPVCSECKVTLVCCICRCWWEMNRVPVVCSHPTPLSLHLGRYLSDLPDAARKMRESLRRWTATFVSSFFAQLNVETVDVTEVRSKINPVWTSACKRMTSSLMPASARMGCLGISAPERPPGGHRPISRVSRRPH